MNLGICTTSVQVKDHKKLIFGVSGICGSISLQTKKKSNTQKWLRQAFLHGTRVVIFIAASQISAMPLFFVTANHCLY